VRDVSLGRHSLPSQRCTLTRSDGTDVCLPSVREWLKDRTPFLFPPLSVQSLLPEFDSSHTHTRFDPVWKSSCLFFFYGSQGTRCPFFRCYKKCGCVFQVWISFARVTEPDRDGRIPSFLLPSSGRVLPPVFCWMVGASPSNGEKGFSSVGFIGKSALSPLVPSRVSVRALSTPSRRRQHPRFPLRSTVHLTIL